MPETLASSPLCELPFIHHGFFTREWRNCGLAKNWDQVEVMRNRSAVATSLGARPENLLSCYQIHSPDVVTVTKAWAIEDRPEADAMVTNQKGLALGILTADCVPVLFADPVAQVIGAAHAGWKGALTGVVEKTLEAMTSLGAKTNRVIAALGPCIWQKSYEVSDDYAAAFLAEDAANQSFFLPSQRSGHLMFNLPGYVMARLRRAGVMSIDPPPADTCAEPERFFSYRSVTLAGKKLDGSLISVIMIND